jgi:hypothetical protein
MLNVIYTIKACMLIMYSRLTLGLTAQRLVFYLAIYVAVRKDLIFLFVHCILG